MDVFAVKKNMLVLGVIETVHRARWSRWSSQTAGGCSTENSCLQSDAPCGHKQRKMVFICWQEVTECSVELKLEHK